MCDLVTVFGRVFNRRNWMIPSAAQCDIRKIDTKHILFTHLDITFYVAIPINRDSTAPKPESANRGNRARKRHKTARFQADSRPSRDGSEQFGSDTQGGGLGFWASRIF